MYMYIYMEKKKFSPIFIYFSKPLRLLYSLIIYEIVNFLSSLFNSLLLLSFFLYLKSVPIHMIVHVHVCILCIVDVHVFLGKVTALGVLCCFALFVCLTLLASFFLPSHLSFKNMYILAKGSSSKIAIHINTEHKCICTCNVPGHRSVVLSAAVPQQRPAH